MTFGIPEPIASFVVNPSLFSFARKNIWIPNIEWTCRSWEPYLHMVDEIWAKTHETHRTLSAITQTPVRYIGWTSIDKVLKELSEETICLTTLSDVITTTTIL